MSIDLQAITDEWLQQCGACDAGLPMGCARSDKDYRPAMSALVDEVGRLRATEMQLAAVMAAADAEQEGLRSDVRTYHDRAMASEAAEARWQDRAEAAEAKVARVEALAAELDALAEPYLTGSMFFDDAPTTRLRARASVRRDISVAIRAALDAE